MFVVVCFCLNKGWGKASSIISYNYFILLTHKAIHTYTYTHIFKQNIILQYSKKEKKKRPVFQIIINSALKNIKGKDEANCLETITEIASSSSY